MSDTCGNDEVARVNVQSLEVDPQIFQVVREKQIKVETATAHHAFFGEDAIVANSSPLDSANEELIVLLPEIVKSTEVTTQSERAKVDPQSSDCVYQKRNVDTSIRSMDTVSFQSIPVQYCNIMRFMVHHNRHHKVSRSSCIAKLLLFC